MAHFDLGMAKLCAPVPLRLLKSLQFFFGGSAFGQAGLKPGILSAQSDIFLLEVRNLNLGGLKFGLASGIPK